jgi:hypothetical protein
LFIVLVFAEDTAHTDLPAAIRLGRASLGVSVSGIAVTILIIIIAAAASASKNWSDVGLFCRPKQERRIHIKCNFTGGEENVFQRRLKTTQYYSVQFFGQRI